MSDKEPEKEYKAVFSPCISEDSKFVKRCETQEQAELALNVIEEYTLMLNASLLMPDFINDGGGVYRLIDGEWYQVDGDGNEL